MACLAAGLNNDLKTAEAMVTKGKERSSNQLDVLKNIDQLSGIMYTGFAQWDKAEECLIKASDAAKTIGDLKSFEESMLFLGICHFLKGSVDKSIQITDEALESAQKRGDAHVQVIITSVINNIHFKGCI